MVGQATHDLSVKSAGPDWLDLNYHRSPQPTFTALSIMYQKGLHVSSNWEECCKEVSLFSGRGRWLHCVHKQAFQTRKVKLIYLSALFSKVGPSSDIQLMSSAVGSFPLTGQFLSAPAISTGSDYCLPDPDNVCHWSGHLSLTPVASAFFLRPWGDKQI